MPGHYLPVMATVVITYFLASVEAQNKTQLRDRQDQ